MTPQELIYEEQMIHIRAETLKNQNLPDHVVLARLSKEFGYSSEVRDSIRRHLKNLQQ
jgi:hypothetical protein